MEDRAPATLIKTLAQIFSICLCFMFLQSAIATGANSQWYRCIVNASSHMGFYTYRINQQHCEIYWKEIDTQMNVTECKLPIMAALKPSAQDKYSVVWFNMQTGAFDDYLSRVKDRGTCTLLEKEPDANTPIIPPVPRI